MTRWFVSATVALAGLGLPAGVLADAGTEVGNGVLDVGFSHVDYYLDRPTTQQFAAQVHAWEKSSDAPTAFVVSAMCLRLRHPVVAGLCAATMTVAGSYAFDRLKQADAAGACLHLAVRFGFPSVDAYDDDGRYCRGARS